MVHGPDLSGLAKDRGSVDYSALPPAPYCDNVINVKKWEPIMARRSPWHSLKSNVHHNNTDCNTGNNIERENLRSGTGGKPLCSECSRLS